MLSALRCNNCFTALLLAFVCITADGQGITDNGTTRFDVAVIKPSQTEGRAVNRMIKPLPGANGYMAQNFPVRLMIALMYRVALRQVEGGPAWLDDEYFDVEARADRAYSKDELQAMFRTLLAERFGLRMHTVSRNGRTFALRIDGVLKMRPNPDGPGMNIPVTPAGFDTFVGQGVSMAYLSWFLGQQLQDQERPVVDHTGLAGTYDFKLSYSPAAITSGNADSIPEDVRDRPSLPNALREQLGLKLVPEDGPVQFLIIDKVERPTPN